jgi:hypothetical protein
LYAEAQLVQVYVLDKTSSNLKLNPNLCCHRRASVSLSADFGVISYAPVVVNRSCLNGRHIRLRDSLS